MEFLHDLRWIFTVVGILLVVAAIFEGGLDIKGFKIPKLQKGARVLSAVAGLGFIALGMIPGTLSLPEPDANLRITINTPGAYDRLPETFTVSGTIHGRPPAGHSLWLVMEDDDGDHYGIKPFTPDASGSWSEGVQVSSTWQGREAVILVVRVEGNPPLERLMEERDTRNVLQLNLNVEILTRREVFIKGS